MGKYVVPGFVDIHCHGSLGLAFNGAGKEEVGAMADYRLSRGTATLLATTSASDMQEIENAICSIEERVSTAITL